MIFGIFTEFCNCHPNLILDHSHHPKKKHKLINSHSPFSPPTSSSSRQTLIYILSLDLPILDISSKWNHIIWGHLGLVAFT